MKKSVNTSRIKNKSNKDMILDEENLENMYFGKRSSNEYLFLANETLDTNFKRVKRDSKTNKLNDEDESLDEISPFHAHKMALCKNILTIDQRIEDLKKIKVYYDSNKAPPIVKNRANEKEKLFNFMRMHLRKNRNAKPTLIIMGQPGIGKTLLLNNMINYFNNLQICNMSCDCHQIFRRAKIDCHITTKYNKDVKNIFKKHLKKICICSNDYCSTAQFFNEKAKIDKKMNISKENEKIQNFIDNNIKNESETMKNIQNKKNISKKKSIDTPENIDEEINNNQHIEKKDLMQIKKLMKMKISVEDKTLLKSIENFKFTDSTDNIYKQNKKFFFVFLNSTLYGDSIDFLRNLLLEILNAFGNEYKEEIIEKINLTKDLRNGSLILFYLKKILTFFEYKLFFVIIIDELDSLLKKDNRHFGFIVEFLNCDILNVVKIGVSNTYGISSQVFDYKVSAEISRLIFPPYTESQLKSIIMQRINKAKEDHNLNKANQYVDNPCLTFLSKKLMKNSWGDIRLLVKIFQKMIENKIILLENKKNEIKNKIEELETSKIESIKENISPSKMDFGDAKEEESKLNKQIILSIKDSFKVIDSFFVDKCEKIINSLNISVKILLYSLCEKSGLQGNDVHFNELKSRFKYNLNNYRRDVFDKINEYLEVLNNYGIIMVDKVDSNNQIIKMVYSSQEIVEILEDEEGFLSLLPSQ